MTHTTETYTTTAEFILGFQSAAGLDRIEADAQWAAYSRQLSDAEIDRIEAGGYESGLDEGARFAQFARTAR